MRVLAGTPGAGDTLGLHNPMEATVVQPRRSVEHVALLFLAPYLSGAEHQTLALAQHLSRRCRVSLLVADETAAIIQRERWLRRSLAAVSVISLGPAFAPLPLHRRLLAFARLQSQTLRYLRGTRPQVVHLLLLPTFWLYAPLFYNLRFPTVVTMAGELRYARLRFYSRVRRAILRHAAWHADAIIACSNDERLALGRIGWDRGAHVVTLDNFTDPERFRPPLAAGTDDARLHDPMEVDGADPAASVVQAGTSKEPLVTWAGRLHYEKNPELFVEAAALIHQYCPGARFALFGQGKLEHRVQALVAHHRLNSVLRFAHTADISGELARSSVFVSCQRFENLGSSSLLEAMACGNAIVATNVGHTREIVDETIGELVPPTPHDIARGVVSLLTNPPRCREAGRRARERVLARYSPEKYVQRLLEVYATVMG